METTESLEFEAIHHQIKKDLDGRGVRLEYGDNDHDLGCNDDEEGRPYSYVSGVLVLGKLRPSNGQGQTDSINVWCLISYWDNYLEFCTSVYPRAGDEIERPSCSIYYTDPNLFAKIVQEIDSWIGIIVKAIEMDESEAGQAEIARREEEWLRAIDYKGEDEPGTHPSVIKSREEVRQELRAIDERKSKD